jgi:DNA-binding GntR family transcriptional regulator
MKYMIRSPMYGQSPPRRLVPETDLPRPDGFERRSSGDQAALYIRRLIFDGQLRPGSRVPQDDVAKRLGISRIPVREALIALEREGWVTIEMHRGAFVNALDPQAVRDHYELFGLTYGFAVERAVDRAGPDFVVSLVELERELVDADDPDTIWKLTLRFHDVVVDGAKSPRIRVVLRALPGLIPGNFFALVPGAIDGEKRGFAAIVRAVKKGNGQQAAEQYVKMMRRQGDRVVDVLAARDLFEERS